MIQSSLTASAGLLGSGVDTVAHYDPITGRGFDRF